MLVSEPSSWQAAPTSDVRMSSVTPWRTAVLLRGEAHPCHTLVKLIWIQKSEENRFITDWYLTRIQSHSEFIWAASLTYCFMLEEHFLPKNLEYWRCHGYRRSEITSPPSGHPPMWASPVLVQAGVKGLHTTQLSNVYVYIESSITDLGLFKLWLLPTVTTSWFIIESTIHSDVNKVHLFF